jgi:phosphatidylglycerophosphate synthase
VGGAAALRVGLLLLLLLLQRNLAATSTALVSGCTATVDGWIAESDHHHL